MSLTSQHGTNVRWKTTVEQPGLTLEFEDPTEFVQQATVDDLARTSRISISTSKETQDDADLDLSLQFAPRPLLDDAVRLRVAGPDRTVVEGIRTQLEERLAPGCRFPWVAGSSVGSGIAGLFGTVFLVLSAAGVVYDATPEPVKDMNGGAWVVVGTLGLFVALVSVPWGLLFPKFEWLDDDRRTRWDRWRRKVWGALGTIALGVVATIIAEALI